MSDPDFEAWIQRAREVPILDVAAMLGATLKRSGHDHAGPCPACNGDDGFSVTPAKNVFICRRGGVGGDGIAMAMHVRGIEFVPACEVVLNEPPPRADRMAEPQPIDHEASREQRQDRLSQEQIQQAEVAAKREKDRVRAQGVFDSGRAMPGTHAEKYLKARHLHMPADMLVDLRFVPALEYWGHAEGHDNLQCLGEYPCMVAAFRDVAGKLVGIHRTYLDRDDPVKLKLSSVKLPNGETGKNLAKKMFGTKVGALIRLGPIRPVMAIAEGIETALAWYSLGVGPDEVGLAAAGDLGNLSGQCTGTVPHPTLRGRTIPNGVPDMGAPGMVLPEKVSEVLVLGDGDSDTANTRAYVLASARRQKALGRTVSVHFAPAKMDWNDVLRDAAKGTAV